MDKKDSRTFGSRSRLGDGQVAPMPRKCRETPQNPAAGYRDLLNPVPNALAALKADDARLRTAGCAS